MRDISLGVDSNITIKVVNAKGKVLHKREIHNKATEAMVDGLLRFLSGEFTPSYTNDYDGAGPNRDAIPYIPTYIGLGNPGFTYSSHTYTYDPTQIIEPTYFDTELENEFAIPQKIERVAVTKSNRINYINTNNSSGILMQAYYPAGYLVIDPTTLQPYEDTFIDEEGDRCTYVSEIGLFAGPEDGNLLLARAVFDGEISDEDPKSPIKQSEYSMIIVEWRIGIVSIGDNDTFITEAESTDESES